MALIPTTLQSLLLNLRQRTNMESGGAQGFVTDQELTTYLNHALSVLDAILIEQYDFYKLTPVILSVIPSGNQNLLQLPADFVKFQGLDVVFNPGDADGYLRLTEYAFKNRNLRGNRQRSLVFSPNAMQYHLTGQYITLEPAMIANNWSYRLWYSPDYIPLINYTDTLQPYMDTQSWCQYALFAAACDVLAKQDLDPSFFMQKAEELKNHIQKLAAPNRNSSDAKGIEDTDRERDYEGRFFY